jgi:hypothetical protein
MQRAAEQRLAEELLEAECRARDEQRATWEEERATWERNRAADPVGTPDDEFDGEFDDDNEDDATLKLGWPPLPAESQQLVDAWWAEVKTVYQDWDGREQAGWLLERAVAFLDEHPHLFRYLHLHDEFLLELGAALDFEGRMADHHKLLLRLRGEQPDVYSLGFGYWDLVLLVDALQAGRREDIPACLALFRQEPIPFIDQFAEVVDLLAWHGCEAELRGLLEPTAAVIEDSPGVFDGDFGMRWLTNLAMFPYLERGDDSPEAFEDMCQRVMAVGYIRDDQDNREWLRRGVLMALPTEAEASLDLNQSHSIQFHGDLAWSFAGWLRRTKRLEWSSARFLGEAMLNYWHWTEKKDGNSGGKSGEKKKGKKSGKTKAADTFGLGAGCLRDFLSDYCQDFFGIRTAAALPAMQAYHYFTEYLVARGHLGEVQASQLHTDAGAEFECIRGVVGDNNPAYRVHPTYEELISGPRWHSLKIVD